MSSLQNILKEHRRRRVEYMRRMDQNRVPTLVYSSKPYVKETFCRQRVTYKLTSLVPKIEYNFLMSVKVLSNPNGYNITHHNRQQAFNSKSLLKQLSKRIVVVDSNTQ